MLIPSNDPALFTKTGNAGQSPFVLVFNRAGVKTLPHIVNAVVLTSAFSSANGMLFSASRLLFALGVQGQAPRLVTMVSRNGVPYVAITIASLFSFLAFLNAKNSAGKVFNWFLNLSGSSLATQVDRRGLNETSRCRWGPPQLVDDRHHLSSILLRAESPGC